MTVNNMPQMQEAKDVIVVAHPSAEDCSETPIVFQDWMSLQQTKGMWGDLLQVDEWKQREGEDDDLISHRQKNGWLGRDLMHDVQSPVRILEYYVRYGTSQPLTGLSQGGVGTQLTGIVHFTRRAESHQGYCHGGAMTSVMDDVLGWAAFLVTGRCIPWSGFTVQVNTSLKRPIPVDSCLVVQATIVKVVRRKVSVEATIYDPRVMAGTHGEQQQGDDEDYIAGEAIHATAEGLVVMNRGVLPPDFDRSSTMSTASSSMSDTY